MTRANSKSIFWLTLGGGLGLALGLAVAVGIYLGKNASHPLDALRLQASASHGSSAFAIATGPIDGDVEGIYCLDFVTGDLICYVLNPQTGRGAGAFKTNITSDLAPEKGKAPAYSMVTGTINIRSTTGNARPAASVVYVADGNTGWVAGYSFDWNRQAVSTGSLQAGVMKRVFYEKARAELRE